MTKKSSECLIDEARFFDPEHKQWGYMVICCRQAHADQECPDEREMFRLPAVNGIYGSFAANRAMAATVEVAPVDRPGDEIL